MMTTQSTPVVQLPNSNSSGLLVETFGAKGVYINPGKCCDSTGTVNMTLNFPIIVDIGALGINGRDGVSLNTNTLYYVYLISSSLNSKPTAALFSGSPIAPNLLGGYDVFKLIGFARTDSESTNIIGFYISGTGRVRKYYYDTAYNPSAPITVTTPFNVNLTNLCPAIDNVLVGVNALLNPTNQGTGVFVPGGSSSISSPTTLPRLTANGGSGINFMWIVSKLVSGAPTIIGQFTGTPLQASVAVQAFEFII